MTRQPMLIKLRRSRLPHDLLQLPPKLRMIDDPRAGRLHHVPLLNHPISGPDTFDEKIPLMVHNARPINPKPNIGFLRSGCARIHEQEHKQEHKQERQKKGKKNWRKWE